MGVVVANLRALPLRFPRVLFLIPKDERKLPSVRVGNIVMVE